jgi:cell division protein FtsB
MKARQDVLSSSRARSTTVGARRVRAIVQRVLPLAVLALGGVGTPWLLISTGGTARLERLEHEREQVELEISRLAKRIHEQRARAQAVRSEPREVERVARDKLGLVRQTEVVFQFQPPKAR